MRRFHRVSIDEPTAGTTEQILIGLSPRLEQFHDVLIDTEAITAAVELSGRYIPARINFLFCSWPNLQHVRPRCDLTPSQQ